MTSNDSFQIGASVLREREGVSFGKDEDVGPAEDLLSDVLRLEDLLAVERHDGVRVRLAGPVGRTQLAAVYHLDVEDAGIVRRLARLEDDVDWHESRAQFDDALAAGAVWRGERKVLWRVKALLDEPSGVEPKLAKDLILQVRGTSGSGSATQHD